MASALGPHASARWRAALAAAVQTNCDIADARHAGELTLCTYLLQMREFYRWEQRQALGVTLERQAVGQWIAEREALWATLETEDFAALPLGPGACADPFDADAANAVLQPLGLLYGAGLVGRQRPVFFLAELHATGEREGLPVLQGGSELARTLLAPPAALAGGGRGPIVLRRESLARWCWERVEAFALRPVPGTAAHAMLRCYALELDFHAGLPRWLDDQVETAVLHELGEYRVGQWLGPAWAALRAALPEGRAEIRARALRDQLADLGVTLPALLQRGDEGPLHAWFAAYDGAREEWLPTLPAAYAAWRGGDGEGGDGGRQLRAAITSGHAHLQARAQALLALWASEGEAALGLIVEQLGASAAPKPRAERALSPS